jgi:hypothetical protein
VRVIADHLTASAAWWEAVLLVLALAGLTGSMLALRDAVTDLVFARSMGGSRQEVRSVVALGYLREAAVAFVIQAAVLVVAFAYVINPPQVTSPSEMVWTIRGAIVVIETMLLAQIGLRHYERKRLTAAVNKEA